MTSSSTPGSLGYGQQDPNDSSSDFNKISFLVRQLMSRLNTMKLVKVTAVHLDGGMPPAGGTVDVQPLVNQIDGQGNSTAHGIVAGLPFFRMGGGEWQIIIDPAVGDIGYVVVSDRDISNVKSTKGQANPGSFRKYDLADGIYVGGCLNPAPKAYVQLKSDGSFNLADAFGAMLQSDKAGGFLFTGNVTIMGALAVSGDITGINGVPISGDLDVMGSVNAGNAITAQNNITAGTIDLQTHHHSGVQTGGGNTGPPSG